MGKTHMNIFGAICLVVVGLILSAANLRAASPKPSDVAALLPAFTWVDKRLPGSVFAEDCHKGDGNYYICDYCVVSTKRSGSKENWRYVVDVFYMRLHLREANENKIGWKNTLFNYAKKDFTSFRSYGNDKRWLVRVYVRRKNWCMRKTKQKEPVKAWSGGAGRFLYK